MTLVTFSVALVGSLLGLLLTPARAVCIYCAGLFLYPHALTLQVGSADFSVGRIVILAVLANIVLRRKLHRQFVRSWIDVFLLASYGLGFVALLHTFPSVAVERHAGLFFDTLLPYAAVRLTITSAEAFATFVKGLAIIALPLVAVAVYQTLSGHNPVSALSAHYSFGFTKSLAETYGRLGMHRAAVTFAHPIALGLFFAMVTALIATLWKQKLWPRWVLVAIGGSACLGVFTSLSTGPLFSVACTAMVLAAYPLRRYLPLLLASLVAFLAAIAFLGSTQLHQGIIDTVTGLSYPGSHGQYRIDLIREAFGGGMSGHWLTGYGYVGVGPGTDNTHFHWQHTDLVNLYVHMLVRMGLLGLIPYLLANIAYYVTLTRAVRRAPTPAQSWLAWGMLAAMAGWNVAMMSVGLLAQVTNLLYMTIAISANMTTIVATPPRSRTPAYQP